jgi:predicted nucleic acid-binding protein
MIVADCNIIVHLILKGTESQKVEALLHDDPIWSAPILWRSEFRNVLAKYIRAGHITYYQALEFAEDAEYLMKGGEFEVAAASVLSLVHASACSAYDCEYVALAQELGVKLYTFDRQVLREFPDMAVKP